jgi:hypothetical protein
MADARNEPAWNSQVSATELVSEPPIGPGSRFTTVNRGQRYEAVITQYERPDRLTFEVTGRPMRITGSMTFTDDGAATRLDALFDLEPRGFMKVMLPLLAGSIRRDFPKQFTSFKAFCETQA